MSERASGVVQFVRQNDYGFYSIKVDDEWYGTGSKKDPGCEKGDKVKFSYYMKDDKWATIKGKVTKTGKGKVTSSGSSKSSSNGSNSLSKEEWAEKDARAARGYSLVRAIEFLTLAQTAGTLTFISKAKPAEQYDLLLKAVLDAAATFGEFADGPKAKPVDADEADEDEETEEESEESEDEESEDDEEME